MIPLEVIEECKNILEKENISFIDNSKFTKLSPDNKRISFVDGGNAEIFGTKNLSVQFMRVAHCTYEGTLRVEHKRKEFFAIIKFDEKSSFELYNYEFFMPPVEVESVEQGVDLLRRCIELDYARKLNEEIIMIDGSLECHFEKEKELMNNKFIGLSKTTEKGAYIRDIVKNSPSGCWHYPLSKKTSIIKLHPKSAYVFRIDSFESSVDASEGLLSLSKDPAFLGYPYGLVFVDLMARIREEEKTVLQSYFFSKYGKDIQKHQNLVNAHEILNKAIGR